MNRELLLKNILKTIMTENQVNSFLSYMISDKDLDFLKLASEEVLKNIPSTAFNCVMLSGILGAHIMDNSDIPVSVIYGHLDYSSRRIFCCKEPIPYSTENDIINKSWDGHCWIEINDLIIDISIFRTFG